MRPVAVRRLAWTLCAITWIAILAAVTLGVLSIPESRSTFGRTLGELFVGGAADLAFATIGALVVSRHPRNAVGWISIVAALAMALAILCGEWGFYALYADPGSLPAGLTMAWLTDWIWIPAMLVVNTLLLVFPDGRLPSRRWRVVPWIAAIGMVCVASHEALKSGALTYFPLVDNPYALSGAGEQVAEALGAGYALVNLAAVLSTVAAVMRYRRARGDERQQLKWLASGGVVLAFGIFATNVLVNSDMPIFAGLIVVAAAIGIAVLKYRLYDIDLVINRTLVYGGLTAALAAAYAVSVLVLQLILSPSSDLAVAGSTLAVAALFRPVRGRIQSLVDRRFFRRRYDAQLVLEAFAARLRDEVSLDAVQDALRQAAHDTVAPSYASVWLRPR